MVASRKTSAAFEALLCFILGSTTTALAVTADVAKKCSTLTAKAFPQSATGNPASRNGEVDGLSQRSYFQKCTSNESKEDSVTTDDRH